MQHKVVLNLVINVYIIRIIGLHRSLMSGILQIFSRCEVDLK